MKYHAIYVLLFASVTAFALPVAAQGPDGMQDGVTAFPHQGRPPAGEERRLRNLRLKEAVQAGDLSPEDARRLQRKHPGPPMPPAPGNGMERYGPDGFSRPPPPPPVQRNFWRDKRQKAQEQYQND